MKPLALARGMTMTVPRVDADVLDQDDGADESGRLVGMGAAQDEDAAAFVAAFEDEDVGVAGRARERREIERERAARGQAGRRDRSAPPSAWTGNRGRRRSRPGREAREAARTRRSTAVCGWRSGRTHGTIVPIE